MELNDLPAEKITEAFENIPWACYLQKMKAADQWAIYYSPSFEIKNKEIRHGLSISALGSPVNFEFYIFYKRPKRIKLFFGLINTIKNDYVTDITGQTKKDAIQCPEALRKGNLEFLESKVK